MMIINIARKLSNELVDCIVRLNCESISESTCILLSGVTNIIITYSDN